MNELLGNRIKALRVANELTQEQIADKSSRLFAERNTVYDIGDLL